MNYDNYYKNGGMTKEESVSAIALRIGAKKEAVAKFVEKHKIDTNKLNSDLKSGEVYFMDVITAIVGKPDNKYEKQIVKKYSIKMAMGGKTQGYDDREDERLGMEYGKMSGKDFDGSHAMREHSRRDDARFEERMARGGKIDTLLNDDQLKMLQYINVRNKEGEDEEQYIIMFFEDKKLLSRFDLEYYRDDLINLGYLADIEDRYLVTPAGEEYLKKYGNKMAMGGKTQGYDDREDERLGMEYGKMSGKDFDGSHAMREHSRRDDARFEERMAKGGELTYDDFMVGDFYSNSSEGGKFKFVGKDESGRLRFEDSKGINRIFSPKRMNKYADGGMMADGGEVEAKKRLEELREALRSEDMSYSELLDLQSLAKYIDKDDVELLEAAGVPEFDDDEPSEEMRKLLEEHEKEAKKNRVKITNLGSNSGDDYIASKTTQRKDGSDFLTSEINEGEVTHYWEEYAQGGVMADGGELDKLLKEQQELEFQITDIKLGSDLNTEEGVNKYRKLISPIKDKLRSIDKQLDKLGYEPYASGGMMADGGKLEAGVYRIGKPIKVSPNLYAQKIAEIFDNGDIGTASDYGRSLGDFKSQMYPIITEEQLEAQYRYADGGMMAKGGMVVTSIKDIPNFKQRLDEGKITYRGLGMGKLSDDFYDLAGEGGSRIKVDGKEYYITNSEFDTFNRGKDGLVRIRFDAPYRKSYADGGMMADGGDIYIVEIRVHDEDGDYTEEDYEFDNRKEAFEFARKKGNVHEIYYYPKGTDSNPQRLYAKGGMADGEMMAKGGIMANGGEMGEDVSKSLYVAKLYDNEGNFMGYTIKDKYNVSGKYTLSFDEEKVKENLQELIENPSKLAYYRKNEYADGGMMADAGFVVVSENDGYWYIMSRPTSKQDAEEFLSTLTIPRGEVGKVVSVEDAKNHKKVIGRKYLKMADGGVMSDERDKDGMLYALQEHISSGEIANITNALKYTDIDEIRTKAIQYYLENGDKPYSYAELESVLKKFDHTKMADGGMLTKSNLESIKNKYEENEDENYHGENVILLAKNFGSAEDLSEAKRILNLHKKEGNLSSENGKIRQELHMKLIGKARAEMKKEGIKFDKGGMMADGGTMARGGYVTDLDEVIASSDLKEELKSKMKEGDKIVAFAYTDYGGSFGDKVAIEYFKENHPKNIVFENSAYNGQNGIVFGEVAKDFLEETEDYPLGYEDMESFYYDMQNAQEEKDFKLFLSDIKNKYTIKKDALDWLLENKGGYYSIEPNMVDFSYSELENELEEEGLIKKKKMADGGMMAKGGKISRNKNKNDYKSMFDFFIENNDQPIGKRDLIDMAYKSSNGVDSAIPQSMVGDVDNTAFYVYDYQTDKMGELVDLRMKLKFSNVKVDVTIVQNGELKYGKDLPYELQNATFHQALNYVFTHDDIEQFSIRPRKKFELGGAIIEDQYVGRTAEDIWDSLSKLQRYHFIDDHAIEIEMMKDENYDFNSDKFPESISNDLVKNSVRSDWKDLDEVIQNRFANHIRKGEYAKGGMMADGGEVKSVVDALFEFNEKRGKLNTTFGEKTKEGITALIENDNYSSEEIAKAIFYKNNKKEKISTAYGNKSFFGLQDMIERARGKEFAKGGYMADGGMMAKGGKVSYREAGENYEYVNTFGIEQRDFEKIVDAYHKSPSSDQIDRIDSRMTFNEMRTKYGREKVDEVGNYIHKTHQSHGKMADGGAISNNSTYVPNRDIKDLSLVLKGELKKLKGSDIFDGVYVKNKLPRKKVEKQDVDDAQKIFDEIIKKYKNDKYYDAKDEIIYTPATIQSLLDIGLDKKDIMILMFGYGLIEADKIKCDNEFRGYLNGLIGISSDYKTRTIDKFLKDSKMGYFEMGLKYPSFDWQKVVDLYNINLTPKIITTESDKMTNNYEVWTGDGVAIGHQISYQWKGEKLQQSGDEIGVVNLTKPTKFQIDREYPAGFNGGYWGIIVKEKDDLYRIIQMLVAQKSGYLKDLEVFVNGLGGIGSEDVFGEFAKGGEIKNKWEYTDKDEIEYVVVKDKNGKELKFDGKDVISGVHDLLEKGGKLTEIGKYYSKNDVVSVFVNGKNILDKNTVSGVWIDKNAKPMAEDVADTKIGKTTIRKGANGWVAKTFVDNFKGFDWEITTIKNYKGDLTTTAQGGKSEDRGGYQSFSFAIFGDPSIRLKTSRPARVTDKIVSEQHTEAMKDWKERQDEISEMVDQIQAKKKMADGGAIGFDALAKKVAKNYEGDKVKKEFQDEYGKTYDKKEAEEVGKKVAGKVYRQQQAKGKMAKGGKVAKKTRTNYTRSENKMTLISRKASEIRKANEPWKDAFNRAKAIIG